VSSSLCRLFFKRPAPKRILMTVFKSLQTQRTIRLWVSQSGSSLLGSAECVCSVEGFGWADSREMSSK
jgi:hypothetical protein